MIDRPSYSVQIIKSKRRSISIQVYHDGAVKVRVPKGVKQDVIDKIIKSKKSWIESKIAFFKQSQNTNLKKKEYADGEIFYYLGRQYKLNIIESKLNFVELIGDVILVYKNSRSSVKKILHKWFLSRAMAFFNERLRINFEIFSLYYKYRLPMLKLRKMRSRWGSMSSRGIMTLNVHLISAPVECIDYVIMHELCHLKWQSHGKRFYQLQERLVPNYKDLKKKLRSFSQELRAI